MLTPGLADLREAADALLASRAAKEWRNEHSHGTVESVIWPLGNGSATGGGWDAKVRT
jgi:hypothetical protein